MISFLIAFWFMCLQDSGAPTRSVVAGVCGVILILTAWCIWTSWEEHPASDAKPPDVHLSFEKDYARQKPKRFKFERIEETSPQHSPQDPARQSTTLSWSTSLKAPFKRSWPSTMMTAVEPTESLSHAIHSQHQS